MSDEREGLPVGLVALIAVGAAVVGVLVGVLLLGGGEAAVEVSADPTPAPVEAPAEPTPEATAVPTSPPVPTPTFTPRTVRAPTPRPQPTPIERRNDEGLVIIAPGEAVVLYDDARVPIWEVTVSNARLVPGGGKFFPEGGVGDALVFDYTVDHYGPGELDLLFAFGWKYYGADGIVYQSTSGESSYDSDRLSLPTLIGGGSATITASVVMAPGAFGAEDMRMRHNFTDVAIIELDVEQ